MPTGRPASSLVLRVPSKSRERGIWLHPTLTRESLLVHCQPTDKTEYARFMVPRRPPAQIDQTVKSTTSQSLCCMHTMSILVQKNLSIIKCRCFDVYLQYCKTNCMFKFNRLPKTPASYSCSVISKRTFCRSAIDLLERGANHYWGVFFFWNTKSHPQHQSKYNANNIISVSEIN